MAELKKSTPVYFSQNELGALDEILWKQVHYLRQNPTEENKVRLKFMRRLKRKIKRHRQTRGWAPKYNTVVFVKN